MPAEHPFHISAVRSGLFLCACLLFASAIAAKRSGSRPAAGVAAIANGMLAPANQRPIEIQFEQTDNHAGQRLADFAAQNLWSQSPIVVATVANTSQSRSGPFVTLRVETVLAGDLTPGDVQLKDSFEVRICCVRSQWRRVSRMFPRGNRIFVFLGSDKSGLKVVDVAPYDAEAHKLYDVVAGRQPASDLRILLPPGKPLTSDALRILAVGKRPEVAALQLDLLHEATLVYLANPAAAAANESGRRMDKLAGVLPARPTAAQAARVVDDAITCLPFVDPGGSRAGSRFAIQCLEQYAPQVDEAKKKQLRRLLTERVKGIGSSTERDYARINSMQILVRIGDSEVLDLLLHEEGVRPIGVLHLEIVQHIASLAKATDAAGQNKVNERWIAIIEEAVSDPQASAEHYAQRIALHLYGFKPDASQRVRLEQARAKARDAELKRWIGEALQVQASAATALGASSGAD